MNSLTRSLRAFFVCSIVVFFFTPLHAAAQTATQKRVVSDIRLAREKFQRESAALREDILKLFKARQNAIQSQKEGADEAIDQLLEERDLFLSSGVLPPDEKFEKISRRYAAIVSELKNVYGTNKARLDADGPSDLLDSLIKESALFGQTWDLAPWTDILSTAIPPEDLKVSPGKDFSTIDIGLRGEYRVEFQATKLQDNLEPLQIDLPTSNGNRSVVLVPTEFKKKTKVILAVSDDGIFSDLGIDGPIQFSKRGKIEAHEREISFKCDQGIVRIDSVKVKAIIRGKPDAIRKVVAKVKAVQNAIKSMRADVDKGDWRIENGVLIQTELVKGARLWFGDPEWANYDFEFEANTIGGAQSWGAQFHCSPDRKSDRGFAPGNFGNSWHDLTMVVNGQWINDRPCSPGSIDFNRWYKIKIKVRGPAIICYVDGNEMIRGTDQRFEKGQLGFVCWDSKSQFRNIRVTAEDGKELWNGLPKLP